MPEQPELPPELPLEYHMYDHYTVELRKGAIGDMQTVRSYTARSTDDAASLIEGLRDNALQRDGVTWQNDEIDDHGNLYGMVEGTVWHISVVPPLSVALQNA